MVKLSFYGGAGEVTGSNFLVDTGRHQYLIDCGLFQGSDLLVEHNDEPFPYDPKQITAVAVTHAHLDHIGRLPKLVKEGYAGPILATEATIELAILGLKDTLELMSDRRHRHNQPPLYDRVDLRRTIDRFLPVGYHQPHKLPDGDELIFYDAGHILGSASIFLQADGHKFVFSGDIGSWPNPLLPQPESAISADTVVMEATYGGEDRSDQDREKILLKAFDWIMRNRGVLLIPAFALERSQELLYLLNDLSNRRLLPDIPIFLDSPLAIEALEVFERHQELLSPTAKQAGRHDADIFNFRKLVLAASVEDSKEINEQAPPKVIIAGSGMMEGGRIHHHLKRYLDRPNTYLLVIGFQAPGTLGSRIISGRTEVRLDGRVVPVRAKVETAEGFSSHADSPKLLEWVRQIRLTDNSHRPRIFLVHSDKKRAEAFRQILTKQLPNIAVAEAGLNQTIELDN